MKMKKGMTIIVIVLLILIANEGYRTIKYNNENKHLREIKKEYQEITEEITKYQTIKSDLELISNKNSSIQSKINETNDKITNLNNEIADYKKKIANLNHELSK